MTVIMAKYGKSTSVSSSPDTKAQATSLSKHVYDAEIETEVFKFSKFPQLPIELQLMIWRAALPTREVALYPFLDPNRDLVFFDIHTILHDKDCVKFKVFLRRDLALIKQIRILKLRGFYHPDLPIGYMMKCIKIPRKAFRDWKNSGW